MDNISCTYGGQRMSIRKTNMNGFTLLEVLASIVILSIVVVTFLSFFPQMDLINKNTKDNLDSVAVAKELLAELKPFEYTEIDRSSNPITLSTDPPTVLAKDDQQSTADFLIIHGTYRGKGITVTINRKEEMYHTSEYLDKHEMKIEVFESIQKSNPSSTIYGFIHH